MDQVAPAVTLSPPNLKGDSAMRHDSPVDTYFGALVNAARLTLAAWSTAANLLDPWAPVRACTWLRRQLTRIS